MTTSKLASSAPVTPPDSSDNAETLTILVDVPVGAPEAMRARAVKGEIVERGSVIPKAFNAEELAAALEQFVRATGPAIQKAAKASKALGTLGLAEVKVYAAFEASGQLRIAGAAMGLRGEAGFELIFRDDAVSVRARAGSAE